MFWFSLGERYSQRTLRKKKLEIVVAIHKTVSGNFQVRKTISRNKGNESTRVFK